MPRRLVGFPRASISLAARRGRSRPRLGVLPKGPCVLRRGHRARAFRVGARGLLGSAAAVVVAAAGTGSADARGVFASTPPMGWNPWYQYGCRLDDAVVRRNADALVASGMRAAGYRYVNIDDCWMAVDRDRRGNLLADPVRFPHGIKALGDYVHARGLRLGIYLDAGQRTCAQRPGSAGHFEQDARTVAGWGADFVKVDWCNTGNPHSRRVYARFRSAIAGTGRPMVFSICNWGMDQPWRWGPGIGAQMWRTGGDLTWYGAPPDWWGAVQTLAAKTLRVTSYARPGAWNESDVVLVGTNTLNEIGSAIPTGDPATGSLSDEKARAQFSLWSMLAVPLFTDNELTTMSAATRATLLNKEVIAVDQDSLAAPSSVITRYATGAQLWTRRLSNGDRALLAFNPGNRTFHATVDLRRIGLGRLRYRARDLWAHVSRPPAATVPLDVAPTSAALLRLRPRGS